MTIDRVCCYRSIIFLCISVLSHYWMSSCVVKSMRFKTTALLQHYWIIIDQIVHNFSWRTHYVISLYSTDHPTLNHTPHPSNTHFASFTVLSRKMSYFWLGQVVSHLKPDMILKLKEEMGRFSGESVCHMTAREAKHWEEFPNDKWS